MEVEVADHLLQIGYKGETKKYLSNAPIGNLVSEFRGDRLTFDSRSNFSGSLSMIILSIVEFSVCVRASREVCTFLEELIG